MQMRYVYIALFTPLCMCNNDYISTMQTTPGEFLKNGELYAAHTCDMWGLSVLASHYTTTLAYQLLKVYLSFYHHNSIESCFYYREKRLMAFYHHFFLRYMMIVAVLYSVCYSVCLKVKCTSLPHTNSLQCKPTESF